MDDEPRAAAGQPACQPQAEQRGQAQTRRLMNTRDCSPRASLASSAAISGALIPSSAQGSRLGANATPAAAPERLQRSGSLSQRYAPRAWTSD
jgi:hypothetical protein